MFHEAKPVFEELPGWKNDLARADPARRLPQAALEYVACLGERVGVPMMFVGGAPGRDQYVRLG